MLYPADAHAPLTARGWSEAWVRDAIAAVAADAAAAYDPVELWPAHAWDGWSAALPLKNLYCGAAGVALGLDRVLRLGLAESAVDPAQVALASLAAFRAEPDFITQGELPEQKWSALLGGESGILLAAWLLTGNDEHAAALLQRVRENVGNPANELMWGTPGTLLAARIVHARAGTEQWSEAVAESEAAVRDARDADGLWTQDLYGRRERLLGPPHGLVGNVVALRESGNASEILARAAVVEGDRANWPPAAGGGGGELRLQWCHGAPGIVLHAAGYLDEELLLSGARLIWDAGPLGDEKGAGLCHGTAGNGYGLLRTFERTGDERWLDRARAFAVHALEQSQRLPSRFSLFTGGIGVALFAADCLEGRAAFPLLEGT
jgi:hypothetical protein